MTRSRLLLGFLLLTSVAALAQSPGSAPAAPIDWRFAHANADMKVSINLQALLKSDLVAKMIEQGKAQAKDNAAQIDLAMAMIRTVDRVMISMHQKAPNDMDVLAEVTGSFDSQLIAGLVPKTGKTQIKVIGPHSILFGEGDSFAAALKRVNGPAPATLPADGEQSDLWIEAGSALFAQSNQPIPPMLQSLKSLSMGLNLGDAPEISLTLNASDAAGAAEMLSTVQTMMPILLASSPDAAAAAKTLSFKQDGAKLRMHYIVPPEVLAMAQQQLSSGALNSQLSPLLGNFGLGGGTASPTPAARSTASPASREAPPQNGGKIKIFGLDDGPKEIPAQK